jgi:DNA-binding PadR family transcriptional regulator
VRYGRHGCGPGGHGERFGIPEGLIAMARGRDSWGAGSDWDFGERFGHHRRGRRRMFEGGELRLVLLKLIADQPRHGYDLIRAIEELTGGEYAPSPGVIYPTLTLLQDMGLIEEAAGEGPRKNFGATAEGRDYLDQRTEEVEALFERLRDLQPSQHAAGASPLWRAMRNLGVAIRHRVGRGNLTEETLYEAAALIDELAQKIERLK